MRPLVSSTAWPICCAACTICLAIGFCWPIIMAISMYVQTKLNPTPPDPVQAKVMALMPLIFGIMFFLFPAGLVLYWVVNNTLSILQQWMITRRIEQG